MSVHIDSATYSEVVDTLDDISFVARAAFLETGLHEELSARQPRIQIAEDPIFANRQLDRKLWSVPFRRRADRARGEVHGLLFAGRTERPSAVLRVGNGDGRLGLGNRENRRRVLRVGDQFLDLVDVFLALPDGVRVKAAETSTPAASRTAAPRLPPPRLPPLPGFPPLCRPLCRASPSVVSMPKATSLGNSLRSRFNFQRPANATGGAAAMSAHPHAQTKQSSINSDRGHVMTGSSVDCVIDWAVECACGVRGGPHERLL